MFSDHAREITAYPNGTTKSLLLGEPESRTRGDMSAWLRENTGRDMRLTRAFFDDPTDPNRTSFETARSQVRTFHDRADKLLQFLELETAFAGQELKEAPEWVARAWALHRRELRAILRYLCDSGRVATLSRRLYQIAPGGWLHLEKLKEINPESQQGFVAMWFNDITNPAWLEAFKPAIEEAGYIPFRIDLKPHVNRIDDELIAEIRRSRFLVADLTGHRGGVYYEAGFAQSRGLPVFWTCRDDHFVYVHFDTRQFNCVRWIDDEPGRRELKDKLRWWIEAVLGRGPAGAAQQAQ